MEENNPNYESWADVEPNQLKSRHQVNSILELIPFKVHYWNFRSDMVLKYNNKHFVLNGDNDYWQSFYDKLVADALESLQYSDKIMLTSISDHKYFTDVFSEFTIWAYPSVNNYGKVIGIDTIQRFEFTYREVEKSSIQEFAQYSDRAIKYNEYCFNGTNFMAQADGYVLLVAPTGSGKTYNATSSMLKVGNKYENIIYMNLELTKEDIILRLLEHTKGDFKRVREVEKKLVVLSDEFKSFYSNIDNFLTLCKRFPKSMIIIDNIDNIKSGHENDYLDQSRFIQELDAYLKSQEGNQSTGLVLSQLSKVREPFYVNVGTKTEPRWEFNPDINEGIVSGAKQLTNNARSVILVLKNMHVKYPNNQFDMQVLKFGSGTLSIYFDSKQQILEKLENYKQWVKDEMLPF